MFGTIRKHQTWLWVFIIALVSVSMVVFFSSDVTLTGAGKASGDWGSIQGRPIAPTEYLESMNEIKTRYLLQNGKLPPSDENTSRALERETISRVFLVKKLKELDVQPSEKAIAMLIHEQIRDIPLENLEREYLAPNGLSRADYLRFARHEAGIRQLAATAASTAQLVNPREAETLYRKDHQEVLTQLALVWASNYLDQVVITNGAIGAYYTNWMGTYRIPERTFLSYVEFSASNYFAEADKELAAITNLSARIDDLYLRLGTNSPLLQDTNGVPLPEAAAKQKIKDEQRLNFGLNAARRAASEFGTALIEIKPDPNKVENLDKLAAAKGIVIKVTKPFDATKGLEEFEDDAEPGERPDQERESLRDFIRREALKLTDDKPIRFSPIPGRHAVYIIARQGKIPAELPPLEKVQEQVTNDFRQFVSRELARKAGQSFYTNLTNGLAQKKSFEQICAEEKIPLINVPPFSLSTEIITNIDSRIKVGLLKNLALDLEVGKTSPYIPFSQDGGMVLYVKDRPKLDDAAVKAGLPQFMGQLRIARYNDAFYQWMRRQAEQARLSFPKHETTIGAN